MKVILTIIGLAFNVAGAVILAIPLLKTKVKLDEEYKITKTGVDERGESWFERGLFVKNKCFGLCGMGLIIFGFLLQLLGQISSFVKP